MSIYRVGQNYVFTFQTKNAAGQLYDPVSVQVSDLKPESEDVLTYSGISPRDSWLTRLGTGIYRVVYALDVPGEHTFSKRWSDDSFATSFHGQEESIQVYSDRHEWTDTPGPVGTHYVYYGVGAAGISDQATLEAMTRDGITSAFNFVATVSPSSQKVYICHLASWGTPLITLDGFAIDQLATSTVALHDFTGDELDYMVHETTNLLTGANLSFVVNF